MPEQGPRKTGDPGKFGGNSENVHPQHTKPVPGKSNSRPGVASSKIPVSKPLRVPLKRVQTQPSTRAAKETTSTRKNSSEVCAEGSAICTGSKELLKENIVCLTKPSQTATRVKKVPDFKKLHDKWQQKIEKAKRKKRSAIEVKEFPLTPSGKFMPTTPHARSADDKEEDPAISTTPVARATTATKTSPQTSPFKVDSESLQTILHGNGGEPPSLSHRATLGAWPRVIPGELKLPQTSYRYSMYRRRWPEEISAESALGKSPSMFSSVSHVKGRELLERLASTTLNSVRTVARVNTSSNHDMSAIRMNLNSQLTEAEGDDIDHKSHPFSAYSAPDSNGRTNSQSSLSQPWIEQRVPIRVASTLQRDEFYAIEPELCNLLGGGGARCIGGRSQCRSPVAQRLNQVYFIPVQ